MILCDSLGFSWILWDSFWVIRILDTFSSWNHLIEGDSSGFLMILWDSLRIWRDSTFYLDILHARLSPKPRNTTRTSSNLHFIIIQRSASRACAGHVTTRNHPPPTHPPTSPISPSRKYHKNWNNFKFLLRCHLHLKGRKKRSSRVNPLEPTGAHWNPLGN